MFYFFASSITIKRLDRFAWNFQGRCGMTTWRPAYIFGQFRETARCRDAQHGDGVCCVFEQQLVYYIALVYYASISWLPCFRRSQTSNFTVSTSSYHVVCPMQYIAGTEYKFSYCLETARRESLPKLLKFCGRMRYWTWKWQPRPKWPWNVLQGHQKWHQSKSSVRFPISSL